MATQIFLWSLYLLLTAFWMAYDHLLALLCWDLLMYVSLPGVGQKSKIKEGELKVYRFLRGWYLFVEIVAAAAGAYICLVLTDRPDPKLIFWFTLCVFPAPIVAFFAIRLLIAVCSTCRCLRA